jgi:hypothetical protein
MRHTMSEMPDEQLTALRYELLRLAKEHDDLAAQEAASVPYWAPCPASVGGHRAAAKALRCDADQIIAA